MMRAELGKPIARGGVSELYALPDGRVLKLYRRGFGAGVARDEAAVTARLHALGMRVPVVGAPVEVEGRFGFPMQRIDGTLLAESVVADPASAARTAAELHVAMHALTDTTLPALRPRFEKILGSKAASDGNAEAGARRSARAARARPGLPWRLPRRKYPDDLERPLRDRLRHRAPGEPARRQHRLGSP